MVATGRRVFDSDVATVLQLDDFSCSICSATWCLRSIGVDVNQDTMRGLMMPGLVSSELGLLDGSGAGIARLFRDRFGLPAQHQQVATFDDVVARAGNQPLAIGGHRWSNGVGHWVGVRRFENGELVLANPGGTGPRFGQQRLDRAAFDQRGPFSMVSIDVEGSVEPVRPSDPSVVPDVVEPPFVAAGSFQVVRTDGVGVRIRERPFQDGGRRGAAPEGGDS